MSKRNREHDEDDELKKVKPDIKQQRKSSHEVLADDICFEIISMVDSHWFILKNCTLISKQFYNVIKERSKLNIIFKTTSLSKVKIELLKKSQFINNIINVQFSSSILSYCGGDSIKFISEMQQLTTLNIINNNIDSTGAKVISKMQQLTSLNIRNNKIRAAGCKYISKLKQLTSLNINYNPIRLEGVKFISEMKQLTSLDTSYNSIGVEGAKYISEMKQLTLLIIRNNEIGTEGCKYISEMKQLTKLDAQQNEIGNEGVKFLINLKHLIFI